MKNTNNNKIPFWKAKSFEDMTDNEWESLCDRCGKCCLHKLEDKDTGRVFYTAVACKFLDIDRCRCLSYENRLEKVHDCLKLTRNKDEAFDWLPKTCSYRLISNSQDLYWWHPLVSGEQDSIHLSGVSVKNRAISENSINIDDLEAYVLDADI